MIIKSSDGSINQSELYSDESYLAHHGVLGMKWGRRKSPEKNNSNGSNSNRSDSSDADTKVAAALGTLAGARRKYGVDKNGKLNMRKMSREDIESVMNAGKVLAEHRKNTGTSVSNNFNNNVKTPSMRKPKKLTKEERRRVASAMEVLAKAQGHSVKMRHVYFT